MSMFVDINEIIKLLVIDFALKFTQMKKNLLFALSVFLITIVGLLVFSEASKKTSEETSQFKSVEQPEEDPNSIAISN